MSDSHPPSIIALGILACAIDTVVLGLISRDRFRGRRCSSIRASALIGVSHCGFAILGMLIHTTYSSSQGPVGDYLVIAISLGIAALGGMLSQAKHADQGSLLAGMLVGIDAVPLGAFVAYSRQPPIWFFSMLFVTPAIAFLTPLMLTRSYKDNEKDSLCTQ